MNLIIDAGNSFIKIALINSNEFIETVSEKITEWETALDKIILGKKIDKIIFSTVSIQHEALNLKLSTIATTIQLNEQLKFPINIKYKSKNTLGTDRLCSTIGALSMFGTGNLLVIDCGSCITYNFLEAGIDYIGGSISPGIDLRFKALHAFTKNLPLIENNKNKPYLIGEDTKSSIESGVLNGALLEMDGVIEQYKLKWETLKVVLTGGNYTFFANNLKNTTFAHPNLVLIGLNDILEFNS